MIGIAGLSSLSNLGVRAQVRGLIAALPKSESVVLIVASNPTSADTVEVDACLRSDLRPIAEMIRGGRLVVGKSSWVSRYAFSPLVDEMSRVILVGGDIYSTIYRGGTYHLHFLDHLRRRGVPRSFLGQTFGPCDRRGYLAHLLEHLREADFVGVRDSVMHSELLEAGVDPGLTPDPAVLLVDEDVDGEAVTGVTACVSAGIAGWTSIGSDHHLRVLRDTLCELASVVGGVVRIVAHVMPPQGRDHEFAATVAETIASRVANDVELIVAPEAEALVAMARDSAIMLSERMHPAYLSLAAGVPTVVVGYSPKALAGLELFLGDEVCARDLLLTIDQLGSEQSRGARLMEAIANARPLLTARVGQIRRLAQRGVEASLGDAAAQADTRSALGRLIAGSQDLL